MKFFPRKTACLAAAFCIAFQSAVFAASSTSSLSSVRFHSGSQHDRIVFDWSEIPSYDVRVTDDGKCIKVTFQGLPEKQWKKESFSGKLVEKVTYEKKHEKLLVKVFLRHPLRYKVETIAESSKVYIDVLASSTISLLHMPETTAPPKPERRKEDIGTGSQPKPGPTRDFTEIELAPGLKKTIYSRWNSDGPVQAFFIEADKSRYRLKPALDNGQVIGRESVSSISAEQNAIAAVNASYFDWGGDILGLLKIDGTIAGTTYINRTAMGIKKDGSVIFGYPHYNGTVTLNRTSWPVGGVDAERGKDSLVIYNHLYGPSTGTNEYGLEFVVKHGKITAIQTGNTRIPRDGIVVSVHGAAMDAFRGARVGDPVSIQEDLGSGWNDVEQIIGAGPRLVENGKVRVTVAAEEFPGDIRYGRAPRSAFGVTKDGNYVLAVVDGRQSQSHGCTLTEWAELLLQYGCVNAMNFDGGGSSALVINGELQNSPSDGSERAVGSALVLVRK